MHLTNKRSVGSFALALLVATVGCGSDGSSSDGGDGKYHPPPNGTHTTEANACQSLLDGYDARYTALSCGPLTSPTCPEYLQAQFGTACLEYDEGSVQGCVAYYDAAKSCDALNTAFANCVITDYPGTAPKGCPTP